ncbi:MAG: energy-coupling factor transporter transmembrane protein EcfT [Oscillospiraceae bacterium]|jgi:energy-coupling factor transport system permease protein|nr:energy-coupling factor transporter transmembrane protein EcfT [Oscillospiraceae bacterium]
MRKADPRVAFLFVFLLSTASVILRGALPLAPALVSAVIAALCAKAPVGRALRRLAGLWVTLASVTALQALFSGDILRGLLAGAAVLERLAILMLGGAMLAAYPGHALVQGMLQLRLPYQLAYMVSVGLRFAPQFSESFQDSLTAIQLRGVDLRRLKIKARLKIYTYLLMPTVAMGVGRSRKLAMAMELRGFGACEKRSSYAPLAMRGRDWLALAGAILWAAALTAGEIIWRRYA